MKRKGFFRVNTIFQLLIAFFLLALFAPAGIILLCFNSVAMASFWEKKTPEELLKHHSKLITRKNRLIVGVGVLVMLASTCVSWLSNISFPLIYFYFGAVDLMAVSNAVGV